MDLPLGCMNRPYNKFPFERALQGIAAAGFSDYAHLQAQPDAALTPATPPEEAARLAATITRHGLRLTMLPSRLPLEEGDEEAVQRGQHQIDRAAALRVP